VDGLLALYKNVRPAEPVMIENIWLFLGAFTVNLRLGLLAVLIGLLIGFVSAVARFKGAGVTSGLTGFLIAFLRAFPVYVLMFVAVNLLASLGALDALTANQAAEVALVIALSAYTTSACSDASLSLLQYRSLGQYSQAWLFLPNVMQIYVITVISSSVGAAIGLQESVTFTINLAETLPDRQDRMLLVFSVILFFVAIMGFTRWGVAQVSSQIANLKARRQS
jgi:hypothetical protein